MALDKQSLLSRQDLGLSDEQADLITRMSEIEEQKTINLEIGKLHGRYDEDFQEIFPDADRGSKKSYKFWPELVKSTQEKAQKVEELESTISELNGKLKGETKDEALKARVEELEALVETTKAESETQIESARTKFEEDIAKQKRSVIEREWDLMTEKLPLRKDLDEKTVNEIMELKKATFFDSYTFEYDEKAGKNVFKQDDKIVRNEKTLEPLGIADIQKELVSAILHKEQEQNGGGSKGSTSSKSTGSFNASEFGNQVEAVSGLKKHITEDLGLKHGSPEFFDKQNELYRDSGIDALPVR